MSFFAELKRRNVIKVAAAYVIVGWLVMQIGEVMAPALRLPDWVLSTLAFFLILGLPIALVLAWAFEMTPEGLKLEKHVERSDSITHITGRKLDFAIIGLMAIALAYFAYDKFVLNRAVETEPVAHKEPATGEQPVPAAASTDNRHSIAVLPFANRSNLEEDLFFTDGIHDDLLTQLAKINDLKVISRTSVMNYRDTSKKIPEIAAELGVATILEGGVQRAGSRIRINAQLIDVNTDEHLWAETFDREMTVENIFEIQSEIANRIVTAVHGELNSPESGSLTQLPTRNLEAYEAFMHARAAMNQPEYTAARFLAAEEWAMKAVALDPGFAWAWAMLSDTRSHIVWIGYDPSPNRQDAARLALDRALALDPDSAETQVALGEYSYRIEADFPAALQAFRQALAKQPGSAYNMERVAFTQRRLGVFDESVESYARTVQLDPGNRSAWSDYLLTLRHQADWDKAISIAQSAAQRFPSEGELQIHLALMLVDSTGDLTMAKAVLDRLPAYPSPSYVELATAIPMYERDFTAVIEAFNQSEVMEFSSFGSGPMGWRHRWLVETYQLMGDRESAANHLEQFAVQFGDDHAQVPRNRALYLSNLGRAYARMGTTEKALQLSEEALAIIRGVGDGFVTPGIEVNHAMVLALTGDRDTALHELERLIGAPGSYTSRWTFTLDPRWDFMRDDERFNDLIRPEDAPESGP